MHFVLVLYCTILYLVPYAASTTCRHDGSASRVTHTYHSWTNHGPTVTLTRAHHPQWLRTLERVTTHEEEMVEQVGMKYREM